MQEIWVLDEAPGAAVQLPSTDSRVSEGRPHTEPEMKTDRRPSTQVKIIAIANQKGGVGKTTTTVNLGAALAMAGRRVLVIDVDPQANTTSGLGLVPAEQQRTTYDLLVRGEAIGGVAIPTDVDGLHLIPAAPDLAGAEVELVDAAGRERRLSDALNLVTSSYDYVLIDCPPSLGLLTLNALVAANSVLIPLQCEYYALEGIGHLLGTLRLVQDRLNPKLDIEGILLTMFDGRLNLSVQVADEARRHFGEKVYTTMIPRNVRLGEAPSFGKPITVYDPTCVGAVSYFNLAKEVLGHE